MKCAMRFDMGDPVQFHSIVCLSMSKILHMFALVLPKRAIASDSVRVCVDRTAARNHSRFSPGHGPITGLHFIQVEVKEVDTGASFWLRNGVLYLSLVGSKKATLEAIGSILIDVHPKKANDPFTGMAIVQVHASGVVRGPSPSTVYLLLRFKPCT
jgi:hypothetical protein